MRTLIAALLLTASAWAQTTQTPNRTAPTQGPPPKNLSVRPDGHISANQDPAEPEKFEVHLVKQGETLSGIAGEVLKNPRLWPQLWEQNEHIVNPHWIYPNDKVLIKPITVLAEAKPPEPEPPPPPPPPQEEPPRRVQLPPPSPPASQQPVERTLLVTPERPVPQIKFSDLYCSGSVRTTPVAAGLRVSAKFETTGGILATGNEYVYISQGAEDGVKVGTTYQVIRPTKEMTNPHARTRAERDLGMHYLDIGQMQVVMVQPDFALARVIHTCADAIDPGDFVMPFQQITVPEPPRSRPFSPTMTVSSGVTGTIVSTKDVMLNFGSTFEGTHHTPGVQGSGLLGPLDRGVAAEGSIVYIDLGQNKTVKPGDLFIVYRHLETDDALYKLPRDVKKIKVGRAAIGELLIVKVGERAATALVTYASDGLTMGDAVERR
jgi:hypothetical protein